MSNEEAKSIVSAGLERRREDRIKRDAALDEQERQLRLIINGNHQEKTMTEIQKQAVAEEEAIRRRAERARAKAERVARDMKAEEACRSYGIWCLVILLLTAVTRIPLAVAIALALGLGVFPMVYIYRLYVPLEEVSK